LSKPFENEIEFAVIGAGRFGTFWGKHLSEIYPTCFYDADPEKEKVVVPFAAWGTMEECLQKKFIFLTIPIGKLEEFLIKNRDKIKPGSVLIDCASVKGPVINWFEEYLPDGIYYVASHPLFGPDSARTHLKDHLMVLMPGHVPFGEYRFLVQLLTEKFGLQVYNMTAKEHDQLMAYNLNLVHHLGRALDDLGISRLPLVMSGLQKLNEIVTVVMNDTQELFLDFNKYNPNSMEILEKWEKSFNKISKSIQSNI
jgi:prephenate dehydrogenase